MDIFSKIYYLYQGINPFMQQSQSFFTPSSVIILKNMVTQDEVNDDSGNCTLLTYKKT
jgi:hypothetical protein